MSVVLVGSENPVKIRAVRRAVQQRTDLPWATAAVVGLPAQSGVEDQPTSLEKTARGAEGRVRWLEEKAADFRSRMPELAWGLVLFVGIESGLFSLGGPRRLDLCVAFVRDSEGRSSFGTSSAVQLPEDVDRWLDHEKVVFERKTLNDACAAVGMTLDPKLGNGPGLVGLMSGGLVTREDYTVEAVRNALFGLCERAQRKP